ncbi:hypothetical protein OIU78_020253 [Salix suchowensis]|nr:hypothetical protein OIU78_020253 [Salix suchowensis]
MVGIVIAASVYHLWQERNRRIYDHHFTGTERLIDEINFSIRGRLANLDRADELPESMLADVGYSLRVSFMHLVYGGACLVFGASFDGAFVRLVGSSGLSAFENDVWRLWFYGLRVLLMVSAGVPFFGLLLFEAGGMGFVLVPCAFFLFRLSGFGLWSVGSLKMTAGGFGLMGCGFFGVCGGSFPLLGFSI